MGMTITFELSDADLQHFHDSMERVRDATQKLDAATIIKHSHDLLHKIRDSAAAEFIRVRLNRLETLIAMVEDVGWGLEEDDRQRVLQALSYFAEAEDLIPDEIPGLGFLDDAIMIELVTRELEHEIIAYRDFLVYRASEQSRLGSDAGDLNRQDWLIERRKQLHSRMRRRRRRGRAESTGSSGFSLF